MKSLLLLSSLLLSAPGYGFEFQNIQVTRGEANGKSFDRISPSLLLEKGESVTVEYFAYREPLAGETGWQPIQFQTPGGELTYHLGPSRQLINTDLLQRQTLSGDLDFALDTFGSDTTRGWDVIYYSVRVSPTGQLPESGSVHFSWAYAYTRSEERRYAAIARVKVPVVMPFDLPAADLAVTPTAVGGTPDAPWVIQLPMIPAAKSLDEILPPFSEVQARIDAQAVDLAKDAAKGRPGWDPNRKIVAPGPETSARIYFFTNRPQSSGFTEKQAWYKRFDFEAGRNDGYAATNARPGWTDIQVPGAGRAKGKLSIAKGLPGSWGDERCSITDRHKMWDHTTHWEFINELWKQPLLIYIHGFNNDFQEAVTRAAQFKIDMGWKGAVLAIDWPSAGLTAAYNEDRRRVETDERNRATIAWLLDALSIENRGLGRLAEERGVRHLLAHSMGNEVLNQTIKELIQRKRLLPNMFQHMIFAAPDVTIDNFQTMLASLQSNQVAQKYTLYYSRKDLAVNTSRFVNLIKLDSLWNPSRILDFLKGRAGVTPHYYPSVDIINADLVNSSLGTIFGDFRHGYFASSDKVLEDISAMVIHGLPPERRLATLRADRQTIGDTAHYTISP